ncbi:MAG: hypothetical protein ACR2Q4_20970, partial [Geminicoccaceae bacterium]
MLMLSCRLDSPWETLRLSWTSMALNLIGLILGLSGHGSSRSSLGWLPVSMAAIPVALSRVIVMSMLVLQAPHAVAAPDPIGVKEAAIDVHLALHEMAALIERLPEDRHQLLATDFRLFTQQITHTIDRLERQAPPLASQAVVHDLNFVADIVRSVTNEIEGQEQSPGDDAALSRRLDQFSSAITPRLDQIEGLLDRWTDQYRGSVFQVETRENSIVVKSLSQLLYKVVQ